MARTGRRFPSKPIVLGALQALAASTGGQQATVTPPRPVVIQAHYPQPAHGGRDADVIAPRPAALANQAILNSGSPRTVVIATADQPQRQRIGRVVAPRPAALTNHAILAGGVPQTVHLAQAAQAPRQRHGSRITQSRVIVVPAAPVTAPPKTVSVILAAQAPRQRHLGAVLEPRPEGLIFTPAAVLTMPLRTVFVYQATL